MDAVSIFIKSVQHYFQGKNIVFAPYLLEKLPVILTRISDLLQILMAQTIQKPIPYFVFYPQHRDWLSGIRRITTPHLSYIYHAVVQDANALACFKHFLHVCTKAYAHFDWKDRTGDNSLIPRWSEYLHDGLKVTHQTGCDNLDCIWVPCRCSLHPSRPTQTQRDACPLSQRIAVLKIRSQKTTSSLRAVVPTM